MYEQAPEAILSSHLKEAGWPRRGGHVLTTALTSFVVKCKWLFRWAQGPPWDGSRKREGLFAPRWGKKVALRAAAVWRFAPPKPPVAPRGNRGLQTRNPSGVWERNLQSGTRVDGVEEKSIAVGVMFGPFSTGPLQGRAFQAVQQGETLSMEFRRELFSVRDMHPTVSKPATGTGAMSWRKTGWSSQSVSNVSEAVEPSRRAPSRPPPPLPARTMRNKQGAGGASPNWAGTATWPPSIAKPPSVSAGLRNTAPSAKPVSTFPAAIERKAIRGTEAPPPSPAISSRTPRDATSCHGA